MTSPSEKKNLLELVTKIKMSSPEHGVEILENAVQRRSSSVSSFESISSSTASQASTAPTEYSLKSHQFEDDFQRKFFIALWENKINETTEILSQFTTVEFLNKFLKKLAVEDDWTNKNHLLVPRLFFNLLKHPIEVECNQKVIRWLLQSESLDSQLKKQFQSFSIHYLARDCQCELLLYVLDKVYSTDEKKTKIEHVNENGFSILHELAMGIVEQELFVVAEISKVTKFLHKEKFNFEIIDLNQQTAKQILEEDLDETYIETSVYQGLLNCF